MTQRVTQISVITRRIMRELEALTSRGIPATPKAVALASGYGSSGDISHQFNYLEENGYIKRHGTRGTRRVTITLEKLLPEAVA